ncbi:MAG: hypothetical protein MZV49_25425 [Rhodopseudomonas palustris]|nr:hypothetical protein [Rhodopseudomonas palustris]
MLGLLHLAAAPILAGSHLWHRQVTPDLVQAEHADHVHFVCDCRRPGC